MLKDIIYRHTRCAGIIALREIKSFFSSPVAYIVLTLYALITGFLFFNDYFIAGQASMRYFFEILPWVLAVFVPAVTMKLFAEERSSGSFELLVTMPLKTGDIVAGKFTASFVLSSFLLVPTLLYCVTVFFSAPSVDAGPVVGGYAGALLLVAAYSSVGIFTSIISSSQVLAFISAFFICFALAFVDYAVQYVPGIIPNVLQQAGTSYHFKNFAKGIVDFRDIVYFVSVVFLFLLGTKKAIDDRR